VAARVTVVGLGPGAPDLVTAGTLAEIERVPVRFLRTVRHPSAHVVGEASSLDHHYEAADRVDDVYPAMVEELVAAAGAHGEVLYAVPGSPRVAERSVDLLTRDGRVEVVVHPALSFLDLAWVRLGVDPLDDGVRLVDGHDFAVQAAGERGPLLVSHCHSRTVLGDIKLAVDEGPDVVTVLQRLGLPDEAVFDVAWADLDRSFAPDHLTSIFVPTLAAPVGAELVRFDELVRTLREHCPWDREQTHRSLTRYLLEETYEVLEAIESGESEHLEEELGDLLFQVYFHATIAAEAGDFTLADVARGIHDKLHRRHPHVFGGADDGDLVQTWEEMKKAEKGRGSVFDGIPSGLPALLYAHKVVRKASTIGVEPQGLPAVDVGDDEETLGTLLLAVVAAAADRKLDGEAALRAAAARLRDAAAAREPAG
jgi:tetrapyrrole methylase family protein/MazG family protein